MKQLRFTKHDDGTFTIISVGQDGKSKRVVGRRVAKKDVPAKVAEEVNRELAALAAGDGS